MSWWARLFAHLRLLRYGPVITAPENPEHRAILTRADRVLDRVIEDYTKVDAVVLVRKRGR